MSDDESRVFADDFNEMSEQDQDLVRQNIVEVEGFLEEMVEKTLSHLRATNDMCPKSCIGVAAEVLDELGRTQALMVLTMAIRTLASQRFQAEEKDRLEAGGQP